jgi:cysteine-rich repeat protein
MRSIYRLVCSAALVMGCGGDDPTRLTADNAVVTTAEDTPVSFTISANLPATFSLGTPPSHGEVTLGSDGATWSYTPAANYNGPDALGVTVTDGKITLDVSVDLTITSVNDLPIAGPDSFATNADTPLTVDTKTLLANDSDLEGGTLTITGADSAVQGGVVFNTDSITFTPALGFAGNASFNYTLSDGSDTVAGTVTVNVGVDQPPVAVDDEFNTNEDVTLDITTAQLLANDTDADGHILTVTDVANCVNCTFTRTGNTISVTPNLDSNLAATFEYTVTDGALTDVGLVTITVAAVADAPVATADAASTDEDTAVQITGLDLLANDTDGDGDVLSITAVGAATNGTVATANGVVTFTPNANFNGTAGFEYTLSDGNGGTATGAVVVTVGPINDNPVAVTDTLTTNEDTAGSVDVATNDTDVDNDPLSVAVLTQPAHGIVVFAGTVATYTPITQYNGPDVFTYTLSDGAGGTAVGTVNITVVSVNDLPVANNDTATVVEDTPTPIAVLGNDTDADGDALSVSAVGTAANGTVVLAGGILTYTPNANFNGSDAFNYTVSDGQGGTDIGAVTITVTAVNDSPVAGADTLTTNEEVAGTVNVLANDTDAENQTITITANSTPLHGTVSFVGGTATYTPEVNYFGPDAFTYTISDGAGGTATGNVTINVVNVQDNPVANDDNATVGEEAPTVINVLANDTDADGDTLVVSAVGTADHGTVTLANGVVTYTGATNYRGPDVFTYIVSDGNGGLDTAVVTLDVSDANDPPVAVADTMTTAEDTAQQLIVTNNDTDADGDTLTIASFTQPANGTVTFVNTRATFVPALNFNGSTSFQYTLSDGRGGTSTTTVSVTVTPVNDRPVAVDDVATVVEETATVIAVLPNDTDVDTGTTLTVSAVGVAAHGTVALAGGVITYTPALNYFGPDAFTYTVSDGTLTDVGAVAITVTNVNDTPVAVNDTLTVNEDASGTRNVTLNDTDADGDTLTIMQFTQPSNGSVTFTNTTATYTPAGNFNGTDSFTYTVRDPSNATATATVNVTVVAVNDPPVAVNDVINTDEDEAATIDPRVNDSDIDGNPLTVTAVTQPAVGGTVTRTNTSVTFTPALNFNGSTSFTYTISDGATGSATATITVNVAPVNDPPNAVNDTITTNEDTVSTGVNLLANDTDVDAATTLTVTANTDPAKGSVVITNGVAVYTPDPNTNGADSFQYTISDSNGGTDTATVAVNVTAVNDPPVAVDDTVTITEDTPSTIAVVGNDTDIENNSLSVTNVANAAGGSVALNNGVITFTPTANLNGANVAVFDYTVSDGQGGTDIGHATISITAANDAPIAVDDTVTIVEDTATTIAVLSNDTDVENDTLSVTSVTNAVGGTVALNAGTITFTPTANLNGNAVARFDYTVSDGNGGTDVGRATISITPSNDAPVAVDDTAIVIEDTATTISVLGNDTDVENNTLAVTAVTNATGGSVALNSGVITFTPTTNLNGAGAAGFDYTVSDGNGGTDVGRVTINITAVNDAPIAVDDARTILEDTATVIVGLVTNDTDVENNTLSVTAVSNATGGSVTLDNGTITFTPTANLSGSNVAGFDYTVSDGANGSDIGRVTITITASNDAPIAVNDTRTIVEDTATTITNLVENDTDADGDSLSVTAVSNATGGTVTLDAGTITFAPTANTSGNGIAGFDYTVSDGNGGTDTGRVTINITADNDPPVAVDDTRTINEDTATIIGTLVSNDTDPENNTLTVSAVANATGGSVQLANGVVTFTPTTNLNGVAAAGFDYTVSDGNSSDVGRVTITINPVNDAPVVVNATANTAVNTPTTITLTGTDVDNDPLTFAIISGPTSGSLSSITPLTSTSASVTFAPVLGAPSASFTFRVNDGTVNSNTATVTITIEGCGNGEVKVGTEQCDDGNVASADGCEADCKFTCGNENGRTPKTVVVDPDTGVCYASYDSQNIDFDAALEECSLAGGGHLVTVRSTAEDEIVKKLVVELDVPMAWIGGHDPTPNETPFIWITGESFNFTAFATGEPNNEGIGPGEADCLTSTPAGWDDESCDTQLSYICEFNDVIVTNCGNGEVDANEECDDNNLDDEDGCRSDCFFTCAASTGAELVVVDPETKNCFAFYKESRTFNDALGFCKIVGGDLATGVLGTEEATMLDAIGASSTKGAWIGADDPTGENKFAWLTGDLVIGGFIDGQPDNLGENENCLFGRVIVPGQVEGWGNENCDQPQAGTLCEFENVFVPNPIAPFEPGSPAQVLFENLSTRGTLSR